MAKKTWIVIGGWVISIVVAIIGTYSAAAQEQNQGQVQSQEQSISININGEQVEINENNAQKVYDNLEENNEALSNEVNSLKEENEALSSENNKYKAYGTDALVSIDKNYASDKVSLLAFDPVNSKDWEKDKGTLKDSLGNDYTVSLPYLIMDSGAYSEYYTNGKYSKLSFKIAAHEDMGQGVFSQIKIYADDILVFTTSEINRKTEMKSYTVDINNAKFIRIECIRTENSNWDSARTLLLDSTLEK